jgi:hypothetical protein
MASHLSRISHLEQTVKSLQSSTAQRSELEAARQEYRKLLEAEHLDGLNIRAHVWALGAFSSVPFFLSRVPASRRKGERGSDCGSVATYRTRPSQDFEAGDERSHLVALSSSHTHFCRKKRSSFSLPSSLLMIKRRSRDDKRERWRERGCVIDTRATRKIRQTKEGEKATFETK